jgi:hypothetical protein
VLPLTWRQFRTQEAALGFLAVIAIVLAGTGPHLVHPGSTTNEPKAIDEG